MLSTIYQTFYDKLPNSLEDVLPVYEGCKIVTCLNPHYMIALKKESYYLYEDFDYICSDGLGPLKLNKIFGKSKSVRLSFDLSSMAGPIFRHLIANNEGMFLIGSEPGDAEKSAGNIEKNFPGLRIVGTHHGFIKDIKDDVIQKIINSGAKVAVIGMGAPMQDDLAICLKKAGFVGTVYTCGGFIHQTTDKMASFPNWANKLGLRWLYRIFTQKGVFKRFMQCIPLFVVTYSWFLLTKCKVK